jgi:mannose-6-phosphate isomerase-like protein (cupin superfamily)
MSKIRATLIAVLAVIAFLASHASTVAQEKPSVGVITVIDHQKLDASFNEALSNGGSAVVWAHKVSGADYNVSAHSRESVKSACKPEGCSHQGFTAVVYVVSGAATLVVGGSAKAGAQDKSSGQPVAGGESHRVSKGDVYLVPPNTIHWYKDVEAPFRYLEVPVP